MKSGVILIGCGGHSLVVYECFTSMGKQIIGYCDKNETTKNPFLIPYLGYELNLSDNLFDLHDLFISVGNNVLRKRIFNSLLKLNGTFVNAIHSSAIVSPSSLLGNTVLVAQGAIINAMSVIKHGVIVNTNASVDHECRIEDFSHIGPGATLCGGVTIGTNTLIGAGSVIREGIMVGDNCIIGAGSVVVKNIHNNSVFYGNPAKQIK
jgi:sugar O-acyltransferase (sialic acid O-acetyltransferase NeuD family)